MCVCELLRVDQILVSRMRPLFDENVAGGDAIADGVISSRGGFGWLVPVSLAARKDDFVDPLAAVKIDRVVNALTENGGNALAPNGRAEHDRCVRLNVRRVVAVSIDSERRAGNYQNQHDDHDLYNPGRSSSHNRLDDITL